MTQWAIAVCVAIGVGALLGLRGGLLLPVAGALGALLVASLALPGTRASLSMLPIIVSPVLACRHA